MLSRILINFLIFVGAAGMVHAQDRIRASYRGGGDPSRGKCTVALQVDGAVDVEIRGDTAFIRNLRGAPGRARRFDCSGPMPARVASFRFDPQEGRGRQTLMRDPRDGGPIVVRIEDREGGAEGYKFDYYWEGGGNYRGGDPGNYRDQDDYHQDRDRWRSEDWRQRPFERVRRDVEHLEFAYQSENDRRRLGRVIEELNEMQDKLARGRFDRGELDDVIEALSRVLRENRLSQRDGAILSDDLERLRHFREHHDEYGAREYR